MKYRRKLNRNIIRIRGGKEGIIDRLIRWTVFYDTKADKLYRQTAEAVREQNAVLCGELLKELGKVTDKLLEFSNRVLPYINARLVSHEINQKVTKRYVFRVPSVIKNNSQWLEKVKEEQKQIPKFDVNKAMEVEEIEEIDEPDYELNQNQIN